MSVEILAKKVGKLKKGTRVYAVDLGDRVVLTDVETDCYCGHHKTETYIRPLKLTKQTKGGEKR